MKKKILIVSHVFPPAQGIGGRRWMKYAKSFVKDKHEVYILTKKTKDIGSLWTKDLSWLKKENINNYKTFYPNILNKNPKSFYGKVFYRISLLLVKVFSFGNYYDRTILDKLLFLYKLNLIIKKKDIGFVIISGAPFSLLYYGAILKHKQIKKTKFIADIRDPWTWNNNYSFENISKVRQEREKRKEKFVVSTFDKVLVPANAMKKHLVTNYSNINIQILTHAIDTDDFIDISHNNNNQGEVILIYGGTVYENSYSVFKRIEQSLTLRKINFTFDIYCSNYGQFKQHALDLKSINVKKKILPKKLFSLIAESTYYIAYYPEKYNDFISTKIFEIVYLRKPIILICEEGELSRFIEDNCLGIHILPHEIEIYLPEYLLGNSKYNNTFDLTDYLFENQIVNVLNF